WRPAGQCKHTSPAESPTRTASRPSVSAPKRQPRGCRDPSPYRPIPKTALERDPEREADSAGRSESGARAARQTPAPRARAAAADKGRVRRATQTPEEAQKSNAERIAILPRHP